MMKKLLVNTLASTFLLSTVAVTATHSADAAALNNAQLDSRTVNSFNKGNIVSAKKINAEMLKLINQERKLNGASALKVDTSSTVAKGLDKRANEIAQYFSHQRPNGQDYKTAFASSIRPSLKGENVAMYSYNPIAENTSAEKYIAIALFKQWNASSQHHANIINKSYKKTALQVKLKYNTQKGKYYYYSAQIFKSK